MTSAPVRGLGKRGRSQRGAVTAELAMALPLLVALTIGLVWLLSVGLAQIRTVDAAREAARSAARGDSAGDAVAAGERVAPDGVRVSVSSAGGEVVARASGQVRGPGGMFDFLPGATVSAEAYASPEEVAEGAEGETG